MNVVRQIRDSLIPALEAIVGAEVDVLQARAPQAIFGIAKRFPAVVVAYAGKPKDGEGPVGRRDLQRYSYRWLIAVVDSDWQTPEGAAMRVSDLTEAIIDGLRTVQMTTVASNPLYLQFESESPEVDPGAAEQGGRYAMVQVWRTNDVKR